MENVKDLQNLLYSSFEKDSKYDASLEAQIEEHSGDELKDLLNQITSPEISKLKTISNDRMDAYYRFLGVVREYLYHKYGFITGAQGKEYFTIVPDPGKEAYEYLGNNSLEMVEDNTIYARMHSSSGVH